MPSPLADAWRIKYPGAYDSVPDDQLEKAIMLKYPGAYDQYATKQEEPGWLESTFNKLFTPPEAITRRAKSFSDWVTTPHLPSSSHPEMPPLGAMNLPLDTNSPAYISANEAEARGAGFLGGAVQGAANQASPANAILALTPEGPIYSGAQAVLGGIQAVHGAHEVYNGEYAKGAGDIGFGAFGLGMGFAPRFRMSEPLLATQNTIAQKSGVIPQVQNLLPENAGPSSGARFYAGEAGVAEAGKKYPYDMGAVRPNPTADAGATIREPEYGEVTQIPGQDAARIPRSQPYTDPDHVASPAPLNTKFQFENPNTDSSPDNEDISMARTAEGKLAIGADVKSLGRMLASSLYSGDVNVIASKELGQNSLDAVRHLGDKGQVDFTFNDRDKWLQVKDNGPGLNKEELETKFTDLGTSGKRDDKNAFGGFGVAKAAALLNGKKVEVTSIVKVGNQLIQHQFSGTPDDLLEGNVDVKTSLAPLKDSHTGVTVRVYVPETDSYGANRFINNLRKYSRGIKANIDVHKVYSWSTDAKPTKLDPEPIDPGEDTPIADLSNESADTSLSIPPGTEREGQSSITMHLLNNGMYQGSYTKYLPAEVANLPNHILVNIRPKVPEGHTDYPFTMNRENLRGTTLDTVNKYVDDNLINPQLKHRANEIQQLYNGMPQYTVPSSTEGSRVAHVYDAGGKLKQYELDHIMQHPDFSKLAGAIGDTVQDILTKIDPEKLTQVVEKTGILFQSPKPGEEKTVFGLNIPNPGKKEHAILVNPFELLYKASDPDTAASAISHVSAHEVAHEWARSEGAAFTYSLEEVYAKMGAKLENALATRIFNVLADPKDPERFSSGIQELLYQYSEIRGREETTPDLLSGTAAKSTDNRPKRPRNVSGNSEPDAAGVIRKLTDAIRNAKPIREEQEQLYSDERARRIGQFRKSRVKGEASAGKAYSKLAGELPKVDFAGVRPLLDQKEVDMLFAVIKRSPKINEWEKATGMRALWKILGEQGGSVPQRGELAVLDKVFGGDFTQTIMMHGGLGVTGIKIADVANVMKSLMASTDLSAPLRQGLPLAYRKEYYTSFRAMFKALGSDKAWAEVQAAIENHPRYQLAIDSGLKLTDPNSLLNREEHFHSSIVEDFESKIPGYNKVKIITRSDRAYNAFLNKLRIDTFGALADLAEKAGRDVGHPNEKDSATPISQQIADFVNNATGRGSLGRLEKIAPELNAVLWSPRLFTSRVKILTNPFNPKFYTKLDPIVRKEYLKALFTVAGAGVIINSLLKMNGARVSTDPTSTDFAKSQFGRVRFDPGGSFQQPIVAATRLITGKETTGTGRQYDLNKPKTAFDPTRWQVLDNFRRSKSSPAWSFAEDFMRGSDMSGIPFDAKKELQERFTPMLINDLVKLYKEDPSLMPFGVPFGTLGGGIQVYENKPQKPKLRLSLK